MLERIDRLEEEPEKQKEEESLRNMWRKYFGDSVFYEDFYFSNVYRKNIVYTIADKGMLHLNPYLCVLRGKERILHYIVGVATRTCCRRTGVMRRLLERSLFDMYRKKESFTYLMPADVRYYQPFSFVSICQKKETVVSEGQEKWLAAADWKNENPTGDRIQFLEYDRLLQEFDKEEQHRLFEQINDILGSRYDIFAKHDEAYFELLAEEKGCQNGNVVFIFNLSAQSVAGFFAYSMDGENVYVEQYVMEQDSGGTDISSYVTAYFKEENSAHITITERFPFMIRIVNFVECIRQFGDCFYHMAQEGKRLFVTDHILSDNTGIYAFTWEDGRISVEKQSISVDMEPDEMMWDIRMTIDEVTQMIFCNGREIFFAEVV